MARSPIFTAASYLTSLQALLPRGLVWPRDPGATLTRLLSAFAESFYRSNVAAADVLAQVFPATTVQLLSEWETTLGLPEPGLPAPTTVIGRQAAVVAALSERGNLSAGYFVGLAAQLGIPATITTFSPTTVNASVLAPMRGVEWAHVWQLNAPASAGSFYTPTGDIVLGVPGFGNPTLDTLLATYKPAYSICIARYE